MLSPFTLSSLAHLKIPKYPTNNPIHPAQPNPIPAADSSQRWDSDDDEVLACKNKQPYEAPNWDDDVAPAVQPSWDEQGGVSGQSGWDNETADVDGGVELWGEEGSQVGQGQAVDANWDSGTAQAWEAESNQPQWEEPQSVRGARGCWVVYCGSISISIRMLLFCGCM